MPLTTQQKQIILDYVKPSDDQSKPLREDTEIGQAYEDGTVTEEEIEEFLQEIADRADTVLSTNPMIELTPELKAAITQVFNDGQQNWDHGDGIPDEDNHPEIAKQYDLVEALTEYAGRDLVAEADEGMEEDDEEDDGY